MSASSATRELDELMASLSDFKVQSNVSRFYCLVVVAAVCQHLLGKDIDDASILRNPEQTVPPALGIDRVKGSFYFILCVSSIAAAGAVRLQFMIWTHVILNILIIFKNTLRF